MEAVIELFKHQVPTTLENKVIGICHGEKFYEFLLTDEECEKAEDMGDFFCVSADNRSFSEAPSFIVAHVLKISRHKCLFKCNI